MKIDLILKFKADIGGAYNREVRSFVAFDDYDNDSNVININCMPPSYVRNDSIIIPTPEYVEWLEEIAEKYFKNK